MIEALIAITLLASSAPSEIRVDVGRGDWKTLPRLKAQARALPTPGMVGQVEAMLKPGGCKLTGQSHNRFDITVPYAVLVEPDGSAGRVIVAETGCEPLESFVGLIVLQLARQGDFHQTGESKARWYSSELNFNLQ